MSGSVNDRRVCITGVGALSTFGLGAETLWHALISGNTNVELIPEEWKNYYKLNSSVYSPLPQIDYKEQGFIKPEVIQFDPVSLNMAIAAKEALLHSGINLSQPDKKNCYSLEGLDENKCGVYVGTGQGGGQSQYQFLKTFTSKQMISKLKEAGVSEEVEEILAYYSGKNRLDKYVVPKQMANAAAAFVGIKFGVTGRVHNASMACASGTLAIGRAYEDIKRGSVDFAITGGTECFQNDDGASFKGFDIANTLIKNVGAIETCNRPFDTDRSGFLFSQGGAASLILEEHSHAMKRGANIIAEVKGYEESFDSFSIMVIEPTGKNVLRMLRNLISRAGVVPDEVEYFNAHGTGTEGNDILEASVIEEVFGEKISVNSTKSLLGHTIGAAGAFEALVTALSIRDSKVHPSLNIENPINALNFIRETSDLNINNAITQSLAFGGTNAALLVSKFFE